VHWPRLSNWYSTLEILNALGRKTWIIAVPLSLALGMAISLTGTPWYYIIGSVLTSAIVIVLSGVAWQLWHCPTDAEVGKRHIVIKKDT
jgi:uncharacterized membrane protein AbrB (regulator of aidB expression)